MGKKLNARQDMYVTLVEKRSDAQRTKPMQNVKIQVYTSAGTPGKPVFFLWVPSLICEYLALFVSI